MPSLKNIIFGKRNHERSGNNVASLVFSKLFSQGRDALLDIFFPRNCLITGAIPEDSPYRYISRAGKSQLNFLEEMTCSSCGAPRPRLLSHHGECVFCRNRKFRFGSSRSLVVYDRSARNLIHAIKYNSVHAAISDLALLSAENEFFSDHLKNSVLVPVPLFPQRERTRGYNQSKLFADALARVIPGTRVEQLLTRTRDTGTQTHLTATSRRVNVRKAFVVPEKLKDAVSAKTRYIVIDDVFTTGSTLSECARALKKAGAKHVDAATFAHG